MRKTLSVAMIAMNEEANLPRTLESVKWADEIVLVDSGSKDRTLRIAQSFGAKTSYHVFDGHGEQKNVALDLCTSDWTLLLDADEVLTLELQAEIRSVLDSEPKYEAYWIPRLNLILRALDSPRRLLSRSQAAPIQTRSSSAQRRRRPALDAAAHWSKGQAQARHAPLRLSHDRYLPRAHEPLQRRDCPAALSRRPHQPLTGLASSGMAC